MATVDILLGKARLILKELSGSPIEGHLTPEPSGMDLGPAQGAILRTSQEFAEFWEAVNLVTTRMTKKSFGVGAALGERSLANLAIILQSSVTGGDTVNVDNTATQTYYTVGLEHERTDGNYFHAVVHKAKQSEASDINIPNEDFDTFDIAFAGEEDTSQTGHEYGTVTIDAAAWT